MSERLDPIDVPLDNEGLAACLKDVAPLGDIIFYSKALLYIGEFDFDDTFNFFLNEYPKKYKYYLLQLLSDYPEIINKNRPLFIEMARLLETEKIDGTVDFETMKQNFIAAVQRTDLTVSTRRYNPELDARVKTIIDKFYKRKRDEEYKKTRCSGEELAEMYLRNLSSPSATTQFCQPHLRRAAIEKLKEEIRKNQIGYATIGHRDGNGRENDILLYEDGTESEGFVDLQHIDDSSYFLGVDRKNHLVIIDASTKKIIKILGRKKDLGFADKEIFWGNMAKNRAMFKNGKFLFRFENAKEETSFLYINGKGKVEKVEGFNCPSKVLLTDDGFICVNQLQNNKEELVHYKENNPIQKSQLCNKIVDFKYSKNGISFIGNNNGIYYLVKGMHSNTKYVFTDASLFTYAGSYFSPIKSCDKAHYVFFEGDLHEGERKYLIVDEDFHRIKSELPEDFLDNNSSKNKNRRKMQIEGKTFYREFSGDGRKIKFLDCDFRLIAEVNLYGPTNKRRNIHFYTKKDERRAALLALLEKKSPEEQEVQDYLGQKESKSTEEMKDKNDRPSYQHILPLVKKIEDDAHKDGISLNITRNPSKELKKKIKKEAREKAKKEKETNKKLKETARKLLDRILEKPETTIVDKAREYINESIFQIRSKCKHLLPLALSLGLGLATGIKLTNLINPQALVNNQQNINERFEGATDPKTANGVDFLKLDRPLETSEIVVTGNFDRYEIASDTWTRGQNMNDHSCFENCDTYRWTLDHVENLTTVILPNLTGGVVREVNGLTEGFSPVILPVEVDDLGRPLVTINPEEPIVSIDYTIVRDQNYLEITYIQQDEYDTFKSKFVTENGDALNSEMPALPDFIEDYIEIIQNLPPKEKLEFFQRYLQNFSYYDWNNELMAQEKSEADFGERLNIMQRRMEDIKKQFPDEEDLRGKKVAGICTDYAQIAVAGLRKLGFLAGMENGYVASNETVNTSDAHLIAYIMWPYGDSFKKIPFDATPGNRNLEETNIDYEQSIKMAKEKILKVINGLLSPEFYFIFFSLIFLMIKRDRVTNSSKKNIVDDNTPRKSLKKQWEEEKKREKENEAAQTGTKDNLAFDKSQIANFLNILSDHLLWSGIKYEDDEEPVDFERLAESVSKGLARFEEPEDSKAENIYNTLNTLIENLSKTPNGNREIICDRLISLFNKPEIKKILPLEDTQFIEFINLLNLLKNEVQE